MIEKRCSKCLHREVCKHASMLNDFVKDKNNRGVFEEAPSYMNEIAERCNHYLIYDERSAESFLKNINSAKSCFNWIIQMCTYDNEASKRTILMQDDKWFDTTFVDCLRRGKKHLDDLINK